MYGPYTLDELKLNPLKSGDKIWYEGINDWMPIEELDSLADFYKPTNITTRNVKKSFLKRFFGL